MHGDVRPGNVVIDEDGDARLANFEMSVLSEGSEDAWASIHGGVPLHYTAPERIDPEAFGYSSSRPTTQSDIFSFACTIFEVCLRFLKPSESDGIYRMP